MKKILLMAAAATLAISGASAKSYKRGVSENEFTVVQQIEVLAPGVSWYYNWGNTAPTTIADFEGVVYNPMCWNGNYSADRIRAFVKEHPETRYLLGFNEPNFVHQSNMTPEQAAERWPAVQALAKELNLKLVAPALNYSPDTWQPIPWMDAFVKLVGEDAFDYTAIHCYGGVGVMQDLATQFYQKYGKKVLVTEFCYWPGGAGNVMVQPEKQIQEMIASVTWLEKTDFIEAYAWFKAIGAYNTNNRPNYGLIIPGTGTNPRELSPQGYVYTYMSDFNPEVWHPINTEIAATEYINADAIMMDKSNRADNPNPIEISRFSAGAWAEWQFDVPETGEYTLRFYCSGKGEPERFDPTLALYRVSDNDEETVLVETGKYKLSNDESVYMPMDFKINLEAGHQTLRLKDMGPFMPSGIRIAAVKLMNSAGVENVAVDAVDAATEYYTLQGIKVAEPVEGRIYIKVKGGKATKVAF